MSSEIAGWGLASAKKRPLKTELYTIYEEDEHIEDPSLLSSGDSRHKSQFDRVSHMKAFIGVLMSLLLLLVRPLLKACPVSLS
ncbi:hypothetical protein SUGI_0761390 [Cryptomeria japonica]|nr:hypothetical protein SUGI_0761390 [Cryptomeria japonica]